jgi:hypothetical protein
VRQAACRGVVLRRASQLNVCALAINLAGKKVERCTETASLQSRDHQHITLPEDSTSRASSCYRPRCMRARAASGHAASPSPAMNSRRRIRDLLRWIVGAYSGPGCVEIEFVQETIP